MCHGQNLFPRPSAAVLASLYLPFSADGMVVPPMAQTVSRWSCVSSGYTLSLPGCTECPPLPNYPVSALAWARHCVPTQATTLAYLCLLCYMDLAPLGGALWLLLGALVLESPGPCSCPHTIPKTHGCPVCVLSCVCLGQPLAV